MTDGFVIDCQGLDGYSPSGLEVEGWVPKLLPLLSCMVPYVVVTE